MRGTRRSARLTGVPSENERPAARPPALPRARSQRSSREGTSIDPRRSVDESRRGTARGGSSEERREAMEIDQSRDDSMGIGSFEEGMGESQGGAQTSGFGYPEYPMGGMSEYSSFVPYPPYMPYMPYSYYPPYPMYPSSPTHPSAAYPEPNEPVPPPEPVAPVGDRH